MGRKSTAETEQERSRHSGAEREAGSPAADETEAERAEREASQRLEQEPENQRRPQTPSPDLTEAKRERDEYLELAQRTRADFDNYRKRVAKETAEAHARGKAELAKQLIPVVDNLERALVAAQSADEGQAGGEAESRFESLVKGVTLVRDELRATLERAGVEAYDPAGEPFDPSWHEALQTRGQEGAEAGTVLETLDKGYRLDGQVLRPARVVVSE